MTACVFEAMSREPRCPSALRLYSAIYSSSLLSRCSKHNDGIMSSCGKVEAKTLPRSKSSTFRSKLSRECSEVLAYTAISGTRCYVPSIVRLKSCSDNFALVWPATNRHRCELDVGVKDTGSWSCPRSSSTQD